jgi:hypothetical protein
MDDELFYSDDEIVYTEEDTDSLLIECIVKMKLFCRDKNNKILSSRNTFEIIKKFYDTQIISSK